MEPTRYSSGTASGTSILRPVKTTIANAVGNDVQNGRDRNKSCSFFFLPPAPAKSAALLTVYACAVQVCIFRFKYIVQVDNMINSATWAGTKNIIVAQIYLLSIMGFNVKHLFLLPPVSGKHFCFVLCV